MNRFFLILGLSAVLLTTSFCLAGQTVWSWSYTPATGESASAAVTSLLYGKKWAYTVEIDDGPISMKTITQPLLANYHFTDAPPGVSGGDELPFVGGASVFCLRVSGNSTYVTWEDLAWLESVGWGIVNHGYWHIGNMSTPLSAAEYRRELFWSQQIFGMKLYDDEYTLWDFAYPNGDYNFQDYLEEFDLRSGTKGSNRHLSPTANFERWERLTLDDGVWSADSYSTLKYFPTGGPGQDDFYIDFTHGMGASGTANYTAWSTRLSTIEDQWGADGTDEIWSAPRSEVLNYYFTYLDASVSVSNGTVTLTIPDDAPKTSLTIRLDNVDPSSQMTAPAGGLLYRQGTTAWITTPTLNSDVAGPALPEPTMYLAYQGAFSTHIDLPSEIDLAAIIIHSNGNISTEYELDIVLTDANDTAQLMPVDHVVSYGLPASAWGKWLLFPLLPDYSTMKAASIDIPACSAFQTIEVYALPGSTTTNQPPSIDAGSGAIITLPTDTVSLDGSVSDDGLPDPPASVSVTWTQQSGPGTVTFTNANAVDTTASFSQSGTYVLRLTATDGSLTSYDEITVVVNPAPSSGSEDLITPLAAGVASGSAYFPMEFAFDSQPTWDDTNRIPTGGGTEGSNAPYYSSRYGYIDFGPDWADLRITAAWTLYRTYSGGDQSGYATLWWDDDTDNVNDNGVSETTLNFNSATGVASVGYEQWIADVDCVGSPVAPQGRYLILGSPVTMTARAKEYAITGYNAASVSNAAPSVAAGSDASVTLPSSASLDGTVTDDGLPDPPASVLVTWAKQSGPGTVTFGDANAVDTTASFSEAGTYVLRLTADDGDLDAYDDVTITVSSASVTLGVITPNASGVATGSAYFPLQNAFDSQPTWDEVNEVPANGGTSGSDAPAYASRYGYIDFGANWADVRITATWTLYRAWSAGDQSGYATMWWDDDYDNVNDNGVTESVLDFNSAQSIPNVSYTQWIQDVDCSSAPVAPQGRYLIIGSPATVTNRAKEYAIIGYTQ